MLDSFIRPDAPNPDFRTDEEFHYIIDNREKYLPESVERAVAELQKRGTVFSDEQMQEITGDVQARAQLATANNSNGGLFSNTNKYNIVEDPDAYSFYSKQAIRGFTILCSTLFGSVLMAINIGKTKNTGGVILVLLFGLIFTTIQVVIINSMHSPGSLTIVFNFIGAFCLDLLFWKKYIGNNTLYRAKPFWIPLIIAFVLGALFVLSFIYNQQA
jgi:hypothetical protein